MKALVLVDLQNDFMPGGALPVPDGDAVVPVANELAKNFDLVIATQDWHPADHGSFASQHAGKRPGDHVELGGIDQVLWPDHCVQGTSGAAFHYGLEAARIQEVFYKGIDPGIDSYSTFFDNAHRRSTGLADFLKARGVTSVYLMGVATDYCVKFSALDAVEAGFETFVVQDGCRGINLHPGNVDRAWEEMSRAGIHLITSEQLLRPGEPHHKKGAQADGVLGSGHFLELHRRNGWEFVHRPGIDDVAVLVATTDGGEAVFVEQYREPVQTRMIEWPAGLVGDDEGEDGEHLLEAANRELEEETGFRAGHIEIIERSPSSGGLTSEVVTFLRSTELVRVGPGGGVEEEDIEVHLVPLEGVEGWLASRKREGKLIDPKVYVGLYFLARERESRP